MDDTERPHHGVAVMKKNNLQWRGGGRGGVTKTAVGQGRKEKLLRWKNLQPQSLFSISSVKDKNEDGDVLKEDLQNTHYFLPICLWHRICK